MGVLCALTSLALGKTLEEMDELFGDHVNAHDVLEKAGQLPVDEKQDMELVA